MSQPALAAAVAAACMILACSAAQPPPATLLVGVIQQGGVPASTNEGQALLSEAYLVRRDGHITITENYADLPAQRSARTSADQARKLIDLLTSPAWQRLASEPRPAAAADDVMVTVEIEGKSVTRWSSAQEPIFREVVGTLAEIRRRGGT